MKCGNVFAEATCAREEGHDGPHRAFKERDFGGYDDRSLYFQTFDGCEWGSWNDLKEAKKLRTV